MPLRPTDLCIQPILHIYLGPNGLTYRPTGFILTLSPIHGINYLDKSFLQRIQSRPGTRAAMDEMSFIGQFLHKYAVSGTKAWDVQSPSWFVIELLTQILITPDHLAGGTPVPHIQSAYLPLARDLVGWSPSEEHLAASLTASSRKPVDILDSKGTNLSIWSASTSYAWTKSRRSTVYPNERLTSSRGFVKTVKSYTATKVRQPQ